jgi:hypothetical protein
MGDWSKAQGRCDRASAGARTRERSRYLKHQQLPERCQGPFISYLPS